SWRRSWSGCESSWRPRSRAGHRETATLPSLLRPPVALAEAQRRAADLDQVAGLQQRPPRDLGAVDVRAAGRVEVLDVVPLPRADDAGVLLLRLAVAEQRDVAPLGPADDQLRPGQHPLPPGPEAGDDGDPGVLEDDLGQADHQPDAHAEHDEAGGAWAPEIV